MRNDFFKKVVNSAYPYIIAEIGANHNGDTDLGKKIIDEAVKSGADAVKFQSWTKDTIFNKKFYHTNNSFVDENFGTLEQMVEKFSLSKGDHLDFKNYCDEKGITFCSTPFSETEADLLEELGVPFFKIASMDLNNLTFLKYVAAKKRTMIVSTGMGTMAEIDAAINAIVSAGNEQIILLHCVSVYPPSDGIVNLNNMLMLADSFGFPSGFSDHTVGTAIPLAAATLGAKVIEKHFTIDKSLPGWDHKVSADPTEMAEICSGSKRIVSALGSYTRALGEQEINQRASFRRSIVLKSNMKAGEILSMENFDFKRPGNGITPDKAKYVAGRKLKADKEADDTLFWEDLD